MDLPSILFSLAILLCKKCRVNQVSLGLSTGYKLGLPDAFQSDFLYPFDLTASGKGLWTGVTATTVLLVHLGLLQTHLDFDPFLNFHFLFFF